MLQPLRQQHENTQLHPKSSSCLVAPPAGEHHQLFYLEYDGDRGVFGQRVVSQVESALFDNHISSAFLLMSGAGVEDKIKTNRRFDKESECFHKHMRTGN